MGIGGKENRLGRNGEASDTQSGLMVDEAEVLENSQVFVDDVDALVSCDH